VKKFWLTVEQRDFIIEDILKQKQALDDATKTKGSMFVRTTELAEQAQQNRDMLVALFKVEDSERI
jgi:hypothetical protein